MTQTHTHRKHTRVEVNIFVLCWMSHFDVEYRNEVTLFRPIG